MSDKPPKTATDGENADYEIGYGRPPLANRFKPGQCGKNLLARRSRVNSA